MTDEELQAWRKAAGERIDPDTADVWFEYEEVINPYGDPPPVPPEYSCRGRVFFAADPVEDIPVCFYDLPKQTQERLEPKRHIADREGWEDLGFVLDSRGIPRDPALRIGPKRQQP
jgi:hypothetical protein